MKLNDSAIEGFIKEVVGADGIKIFRYIDKKENVSEFKIAEKLGLGINYVRNLLYKFQEHNLVSSTRKKDKKKGWYIYYWTFNKQQAMDAMSALKKRKINSLKRILEEENQTRFLVCPSRCMRLDFETSMEHVFKCPECGKLMVEKDNTKTIKEIKRELLQLESGIEAEA